MKYCGMEVLNRSLNNLLAGFSMFSFQFLIAKTIIEFTNLVSAYFYSRLG